MAKYFFLLFIFTSCGVSLPPAVKEANSSQAMVVTAHALATKAGLEVLKDGGNAVDAAIASFYALSVVYPRAGNLGGGGFAVIRSPEGEVYSLDFREKAPIQAHRDLYLDQDGNVVREWSREGGLAVGVPGSVYGMHMLHEKYGKLPLSKLMQPAIRLAKRGFRIGPLEASRLNRYANDFRKWNSEKIPFIKDEKWDANDVLTQKRLSRTLSSIAKHGSLSFYQNEMASKVIHRVEEKGGIMSQNDMDQYRGLWRDAIHSTYLEYDIYSMPPPSSGGITLGQILSSVENHNWNSIHHIEDVHLLIEAERRAFADRATFLGDPDFVEIPTDTLLDAEYLKKRMSDFHADSATSSNAIASGTFDWSRESFETTHLCTADQDGWVVSLTTTINSNYGSKVFVPELGFFLNNEMDDFSAKPGVPNQYGLIGNEANSVASEKRMLSSMTPTIVEKDGEFFLALGTPGGSTIITSVAQVLLNVVNYDMSLYDAVQAPRFHHQWWPDLVMYEEKMDNKLIKGLEKKGHQTKALKSIGLIEAIIRLPNGNYQGVADERGEDHAEGR